LPGGLLPRFFWVAEKAASGAKKPIDSERWITRLKAGASTVARKSHFGELAAIGSFYTIAIQIYSAGGPALPAISQIELQFIAVEQLTNADKKAVWHLS
jgi:hypothetical protein